MTRWLMALALVATTGIGCASGPVVNDPFERLRDAYARRDPEAAASAYVDHAELHYRYAGAAPEDIRGRPAIAGAFRAFFGGLAPHAAIDLQFRLLRRDRSGASGYYRMRIDGADHYGRFDVEFASSGLFVRDTSADATREQFESVDALRRESRP